MLNGEFSNTILVFPKWLSYFVFFVLKQSTHTAFPTNSTLSRGHIYNWRTSFSTFKDISFGQELGFGTSQLWPCIPILVGVDVSISGQRFTPERTSSSPKKAMDTQCDK
ncbi:MAG: hypothetical protein IPL23_29870 [Saprospiraceae bacterium]|nr:hypothetical protein [Saprospiraceae bacterium]